MIRRTLILPLLAVGGAAFANHDAKYVYPPGTDPATVDKVIEVGQKQNKVMDLLLQLTQGVGNRLTGSAQSLKACQWAEKKFKEFGLKNVALEEWGEMPVSFNRGKRQVAKIVAPFEADMVFTTDAWLPGTDGPMRGHVVIEPTTMEEYEKVKDQLKGAWLLQNARGGMRAPTGGGNRTELQQKIDASGILGKVQGTADERVHTGGRFAGLEWDKLPTERRIKIRKSDYDRIRSYTIIGQKVELMFDIENIFVKGPTKLYNVVADIPGTEKPDEMVIVCGHLDSWDGPGSMGANDNGTGTVVAMEAARLLMKSGAKPKRTIRFILWTGEEQGLLGSRAYVQKHKELWPKISAVFNDDGGTNYQGGYQCLESQVPILQAAMDVMNKAFPELPQKLQVVPRMPTGGSSDHASFNMVGIPGFYTMETGRADYGFVWHTQNDRPEFSIKEYLIQSSTNHALVSYSVANAPTMLPRAPQTDGEPKFEILPPAQGASRNYHADHDECDHDDDYWWYFVDVAKRTAAKFIRATAR